MAKRLAAMGQEQYRGLLDDHGRWNGTTRLHEPALALPLRWKKPRVIFVNSMGDLFHESVKPLSIGGVFGVMAACPHHWFIVLTKRAERLVNLLPGPETGVTGPVRGEACQTAYEVAGLDDIPWPLPNVVLGVTVENQDHVDRISWLLRTPAAMRIVSYEPALGPVDFEPFLQYPPYTENYKMGWDDREWHGVDGIICGGESGPGARPMHPDWARSVRDQCVAAGVCFFFKQWGEWLPTGAEFGGPVSSSTDNWSRKMIHTNADGSTFRAEYLNGDPGYVRVGKKKAGAILDGVEWRQVPWVASAS